MSTRTPIQDPPTKAPIVDRQGLVTLRWLAWLDAITRRARATYTDVSTDPPSLAAGASASATVTVNGARAGDIAAASFDPANAGVVVIANVTAADTVTATFLNVSGGTIDLPAGTLRVRVEAWP